MSQTAAQKVWRVVLKAFDLKAMNTVVNQLLDLASANGVSVSMAALPIKSKLVTFLKSAFVYKNHMDRLKSKTHKRVVYLVFKVGQTMGGVFKDFNPIAGVHIEVKPPKI